MIWRQETSRVIGGNGPSPQQRVEFEVEGLRRMYEEAAPEFRSTHAASMSLKPLTINHAHGWRMERVRGAR
jgi:hypothetical protein